MALADESPETRFVTYMQWAKEYEEQGRIEERRAAVEYAAEAALESRAITELLFRMTEEISGEDL